MEPIIMNPSRKPTIDSKLLLNLSKPGRNVLAYIIDKQLSGSDEVVLDKVDVLNYFAENIGRDYAKTYNVERGIADLKENKVISHVALSNTNRYYINTELLSK